MQAFVPKNRRPKFTLTLRIIDLNNVPLVTGTSYVKWHIPSYSTSAEHRGHTTKRSIRDHKVIWDYERKLDVRLTVDKNGMLNASEIEFEVLQEYSPSARAERIVLGSVRLNLAEYAISSTERRDVGGEDGDEEAGLEGERGEEVVGVVRRYLMRESKINSTLKISIHLHPLDANSTVPFTAPPLRSAPAFGGIAGIMTTSTNGDGSNPSGETVDGHMLSMSSKAQESGKLQDMYRQNLAASWAMQAGELPPDKCIEDIFAGGDGWGEGGAPQPFVDGDSEDDLRTLRAGHHARGSSGSTLKPPTTGAGVKGGGKSGGGGNGGSGGGGVGPTAVSGRTSIEQQVSARQDGKRERNIMANEVDEFTEREDLRSWVIKAQS